MMTQVLTGSGLLSSYLMMMESFLLSVFLRKSQLQSLLSQHSPLPHLSPPPHQALPLPHLNQLVMYILTQSSGLFQDTTFLTIFLHSLTLSLTPSCQILSFTRQSWAGTGVLQVFLKVYKMNRNLWQNSSALDLS